MNDARWMRYAWGERGVHEVAGPACQVRIGDYLGTVGLPSNDEIGWCSAFVNWCLTKAEYRGSGSGLARSWLGWGIPLHNIVYGAVCVFSRGADITQGHVAFAIDWLPNGELLCLGGNQQDAVSLQGYDPATLLGARWQT